MKNQRKKNQTARIAFTGLLAGVNSVIDYEDAEKLRQMIISVGDDRYRKVEDCDDIVEDLQKQDSEIRDDFHGMKNDLTELRTKLNILIGILTTIAAPLVPLCVKYLFKVG